MITKKEDNARQKHIGIQVDLYTKWGIQVDWYKIRKKVYARTLQELELVSESNYIFEGRCQQTYKSSFDQINNNVVSYVNE